MNTEPISTDAKVQPSAMKQKHRFDAAPFTRDFRAILPDGCVPAGCPFKMAGPTTSCASRVGWCDVCSLGIFHTQETCASRELAMCRYKSKWLETVCESSL